MNKKEHNLVPILRFPDFKNNKAWLYKFGNELFDQISDKNHNSDLPVLAITQECGAIPRDKIDYNVTVTDKSLESYKIVQEGDFIISLRSFQGGIEYSNYKGICSPAYIILRKRKDDIDDFFRHYFKTKIFIASLNKNIEGIRDGKMVSYRQFSEIQLPLPRSAEQQKIADCLSSVDDYITAESQQLEALKTHKKGLMQQLFPGEGEAVPQLRFDEFKDTSEWQRKILGSLIEIKGRIGYRGYTIEDIVGKGAGAISLSPSNFDGNGSLVFDKATYISWSKYEESPEIMLKENQTVLVKTGSSYGKVALVSKLPEKATINPQIVVLKPLKVEAFFLFLIISHSITQKKIGETVVGGAIPTLSQENISKFEVYVPKEKEQRKISNCFSSLNELIAAQTEKIAAMKLHKKGLMQGLFPQAKGVMGKPKAIPEYDQLTALANR